MIRTRAWLRYIVFTIICAVGLYAFPGSTEIDAQVFAINIGIDRLENGMMRVTVQMPSGEDDGASASSGNSKSDESDDEQDEHSKQLKRAQQIQQQSKQSGYLIATADGVNFRDALNIMTATLPRLLNMSQVKQIVFSEAFAYDPEFMDLVDFMVNRNSIYNAAQIAICLGSAEEFIREQNLILGARLSKAQDAAWYAHQLVGFVPETHISDIYYAAHSGCCDGMAALCATNMFTSEVSSNVDASGTVYAGQISRSGANLNEYMGSALFGSNGMVGRLTGYETQLAQMIRGEIVGMLYMSNGRITELNPRAKTDVAIDLSKDIPRISIGVKLYMQIDDASPSVQDVRAQLEWELLELVQKCQNMGVEPFGFGKKAVRQFLTFEDWNNYHWRDRFAQADVGISVDIEPIDAA